MADSQSLTGSGSGSEEDSEEANESGTEEEETSSSEAEEEEEPLLKYQRFGAGLGFGEEIAGDSKMISCIAVHYRFIVYGMHDGMVFCSDLQGNRLSGKDFSIHAHSVNQICIDVRGEYMASCDDGGKVAISGIFSAKNNSILGFDEPIKAIAIHPNFSGTGNRIYVCGGKELYMIEERRWPMGSKKSVIHAGEGVIADIKWRGNYIVWANDKAVHVYDTIIKKRISCVSKEDSSLIPKLVPCRLHWKNDTTIIIGWEYCVKVCAIKDTLRPTAEPTYSQSTPTKFMEVVSMSRLDCLVSGIATFQDNLVVLGYVLEDADKETGVPSRNALAPQLLVISAKGFNEEPTEMSRDMLPMKGYQIYNCNDYHLESEPGECTYYVVAPMDIIEAKKRTIDDRIEWLMTKERFDDALEQAKKDAINLNRISVLDVGLRYINHLIEKRMYDAAARQCYNVLGGEHKEYWEDVITSFMDKKQLKAIRPYIPRKNPCLGKHIYEAVLNDFLNTDTKLLLDTLKEWQQEAHALYDLQTIVNAVEEKQKATDSSKLQGLLEVSGYLYSLQGEFDRALRVYLQLKHTDVFELIKRHKLWHALLNNLMNLLELDVEQTVKILVLKRETILPSKVVKELETQGRPDYLHKYLDALFQEDSKCGSEYHEMQVELYAKFDKDKLLPFLRLCNDIPLQKALDVCDQFQLVEEMIFLLGRMGNIQEALKLITERLQDVNKAIQFAMEQDDEDLWEDLIKYSRTKPKFITGLLNNVGTHIDPTKLIEQIPSQVEIPHLRDSLVKLLQDFSLQVILLLGYFLSHVWSKYRGQWYHDIRISEVVKYTEFNHWDHYLIALRVGCKKILVKDSNFLMEKLNRHQKKALCVTDDTCCQECGSTLISTDELNEIFVFFCGHVYHSHCLPTRTMPNIQPRCQICFVPVNAKARKR